jgi:hypothetical protein
MFNSMALDTKPAAKTTIRAVVAASLFCMLSDAFRSEVNAQARGLPRYDRMVLLETSSETSANVELGDLNGDGNLDVVLAKGRHWPLVNRVLLGNGKGGFSKPYDLDSISNKSYSSRLFDLDSDGDLDVVVSNDRPDINLVYLNDGDGRFKLSSKFGQSKWPTRNATVADLNNDGFFDVVLANRGGPNVICVNDGRGNFDTKYITFSKYSATTITSADFNNDGLTDLAVPHRDGGQSYVYVQTRGASFDFTKVPFGPKDASIRMAQAADIDSDGNMDIVAIDTKKGAVIYFQVSEGVFSSEKHLGQSSTPYALAVSDLDNDGHHDIIVGFQNARSVIYFNDGSGKSFTSQSFGDGKGSVYGFAVGDIDKDGRLDIAAARSGAPNVIYMAD